MTIHRRNLQYLTIEMYKIKIRLSPLIMNGHFKFRKNPYYNLSSDFHFERSNIHAVWFKSESTGFDGVKIWKYILNHIKIFKNPMKNGCQSAIYFSLLILPDLYLLIQDSLVAKNSCLKSSVPLYFVSFYFAFFLNYIFLCMCLCVCVCVCVCVCLSVYMLHIWISKLE